MRLALRPGGGLTRPPKAAKITTSPTKRKATKAEANIGTQPLSPRGKRCSRRISGRARRTMVSAKATIKGSR